jgi:hypothetical protein
MGQISLSVTQAVVDHVARGHPDQRQIALSRASTDIQGTLSRLRTNNRRALVLGGLVQLIAGDPGAIWSAHNVGSQEFDLLYRLLAIRPGSELRIGCRFE